MSIKSKIIEKIAPVREEVTSILKEYKEKVVSEVTVGQAYGGARGVKIMVWEPSALDPYEGIRFRGYNIPELRQKLPKAPGGEEPLPEGLFFLLLIGDLPSEEDVAEVTKEWHKRSEVPNYVFKMLDSLPKSTHPMTQFSAAILSMQNESQMATRYREGISKYDLWDPVYEDVMNILAKLPAIAAYIYRRSFKGGGDLNYDKSLDWGGNFSHMMGVENPEYKELMRLYLTIHADHEGGNVSAHTTHLVGSALSDAYYSLSAGINGLAGPLHGLANQEVLRWIQATREKLGGGMPTKDQLIKFLWDTLNSGQVIPGYGHAVLRRTDPRYIAQREFALKHMPDDEQFKIVSMLFDVVPDILVKHGKAKNPWPNVDAHSGVLQWYYGVREYDFYTVLFGTSRALGVLASLIWDRILGLPIERPKSVTTEWMKEFISKTAAPPNKKPIYHL